MDKVDHLAAGALVSSATLAAMMSILRRKHLITEQEEREMYEHALLLLEEGHAASPGMAEVYAAARGVIEDQLR